MLCQPSPPVYKAMSTELRLVSAVAYRRRPTTCASEFTVNVACHRSTVDQKKPTISADQPPQR